MLGAWALLNKIGLVMRLLVFGLMFALAGCASQLANQTSLHRELSEWVRAEAPAYMKQYGAMCCAVAAIDDMHYKTSQGYLNRLELLRDVYGSGFMFSPQFPRSDLGKACGFSKGQAEQSNESAYDKAVVAVYCLKNEGGDIGFSRISYLDEAVQRVASHISALTKLQNDKLHDSAKPKTETETIFERPPEP